MAKELALPEPFEPAALTAVLTERLGRPVEFLPLPSGAFGSCGVLVSTDRAEYIGYPADTTPLHQRHIVLHEVGHLLCGHRGAAALAPATERTLLPHLSGELVRRVLGRDGYTEPQEQEAELFATLVAARSSRGGAPLPAPLDDTADRFGWLLGVEGVLGGPPGAVPGGALDGELPSARPDFEQ
ncbi:ImmA/IrrE family metallo-endopeptidase [Kitasatospora sp. MMS16-BH015]|uniref:ImmA/IrrE family metallo-endopeptidase n=1 Tax=Kitasatospora sp. MMS16-BH015 TaxID=2018025 RepID=UPI0020C4664A|nr:ImmA/IrrE family metallo-endopeptidase [Kitasatospora sp. MMS16-BH015]